MSADRTPPATSPSPYMIGIAGWKNSGKTTLVERLVAHFTRSGWRVVTVKHTHHQLRPHDGATDGERHSRAGAIASIVIAPDAWEIDGAHQPSPPPQLTEIPRIIGDTDLIIAEGFKSAPIAKIEARRTASKTRDPLAPSDRNIIAIAADHATDAGNLPLFDLDDVAAIAAFIAAGAAKNG
ncbi:Molybdopterin-guanine dinucleotide biosynthesis protein MobB [Hyphomicrobium sulfonivorans]|uniref:Molybdopterin-guanine dinucleotide biosynthesis protein MobB n=1 Tax=Hyphomicrobium sulfonivorans TaxID=121290 RepID=A0A109B930_HYPSL|nr:molybdopterin-guanine dinucleotide biosynthesis protein B [Hyphomicrobium sulfonivorans]KWT64329.1 Molybdopterin-guanine dinucleotide biosynthesis protein MobB [Hyphomicrobium sulfonivorans]